MVEEGSDALRSSPKDAASPGLRELKSASFCMASARSSDAPALTSPAMLVTNPLACGRILSWLRDP